MRLNTYKLRYVKKVIESCITIDQVRVADKWCQRVFEWLPYVQYVWPMVLNKMERVK